MLKNTLRFTLPRKDLTLDDVDERLGLEPGTSFLWFKRKAAPDWDTLLRLAELLEMTPAETLGMAPSFPDEEAKRQLEILHTHLNGKKASSRLGRAGIALLAIVICVVFFYVMALVLAPR